VIEEGATLGTGCVVLPNVRVGRGTVLGAGAAAVRDAAPDTTVVGTVARPTLRPGRDPIRMTLPVADQDGWLRPHALDLVGDVGAAVPMLCHRGG
jgi:serine acetyltransferase